MTTTVSATSEQRRVLHIVRSEPGRLMCAAAPTDRVVHLSDVDPTALVALIFQYDGVVVW